jgi:hypothetical protein
MSAKSESILVPEIIQKAKTSTPALKSKPAWLKPQSEDRIERILAAHSAAQQGFKTFAVSAVLAGIELVVLKKESGAGHWPDVLRMYLEPAGMTDRHVDRYIQVATSAARKHRVEAAALLASPHSVDAEVWAKLTEHVTSVTNATAWRGIIEGMGMAKRETRGGYRPDPELVMRFAQENGVEADFDKWDEKAQAIFKEWARGARQSPAKTDFGRAQKRAEQNWMPTIGMLQAACEGKASWAAMAPQHRVRFRDLCRRLAELLDKSL